MTSGQVGPKHGERRKGGTDLDAALSSFPIGTMWESAGYKPHFEKEAYMVPSVTYHRETRSVLFQGKTIVLESLTPVLSQNEREKRKKEIERSLYNVFSKYRKSTDNPA